MKKLRLIVCALPAVGLATLFVSPQPARAVSGDIAIFREATGNDAITTTDFDHDWDTTVRSAASYSLVGGTDIQTDPGHHLVIYNSRFDSTGGPDRSEVQSQLLLGGSGIPFGWSQGYIRRLNGQDEAITAGGAILDVPGGQNVSLRSFRTDGNAGATVKREPNGTAIQLLKLDDNWDYARLSLGANQGGPTNNTDWFPVVYDTADELDTGSFAFSGSSADITLKKAGHYLVLANTYAQHGSGSRTDLTQRLTLDGAQVDGSLTSVYMRGAQSTQEGAVSLGMVLETTSDNQVLNVEGFRSSGANLTYVGGRTGLSIVKLPEDAEFLRLSDSTNQDFNPPSGPVPLRWDTEIEEDPGGLAHYTGTYDSRASVLDADDYLFLSAVYDNDDGATRGYHWQRWQENGSTIRGWGHSGRYSRDDQTEAVGNWAGALLDLGHGDWVESITQRLANGGVNEARQNGLQGVRLASLFSPGAGRLTWDGTAGSWADTKWDPEAGGGPAAPAGGESHIIGAGSVTVDTNVTGAGAAHRVTVSGGEVAVNSGRTLEVTGDLGMVVNPGGTLTLAAETSGGAGDGGALEAKRLVLAGTNNLGAGSSLDVSNRLAVVGSSTLEVGAASLTLGGGTDLLVDGTYRQTAGSVNAGQGTFIGNAGGAAGNFELIDGSYRSQSGFRNAFVDGSGGNVQIGATDGSTSPTLRVRGGNFETAQAGAGTVDMYGGTLFQDQNNVILTQDATSTGEFNLHGGTVDTRGFGGGRTNADVNFNAGQGTLNVSGGELIVSRDLQMTSSGSGVGRLNLTAGKVDVMSDVNYRSSGDDQITVGGGTLEMSTGGNVNFVDATDRLNLTGGTLDMGGGDIRVTTPSGQFVFSGGRLENLGTFDASIPTTPDESGNALHGSVGTESAMGLANLVAGQVGGALSFDGANDSVSFGKVPAFEDPGEFSVAMWFNRTGDPAGNSSHGIDSVLLSQGATVGNDNFELGTAGTDIEYYFDSDGGDLNPGTTTASVADNTWHHLVLTYDRTRNDGGEPPHVVEVWLDNTKVGELSNPPDGDLDPAGSDVPLSLGLGRVGSSNNGDFQGMIDEFSFWTRPLTDTEIGNLYNGGAGARADSLADQSSLEIYTPLDNYILPELEQTGGVIAPGASVGTSAIAGHYLLDGGTYEVEIEGLLGPGVSGGNDYIDVVGDALIEDGLLDVLFLDGFRPSLGDTFDVLTAQSITVNNLAVSGMAWRVIGGGNGQILQLYAPEPGSVLLAVLGIFCLGLFGRRRRRVV